ncbi:MAG: nucleoside monophosphate kinase [Candidatus Saccharimonadales bacterium]
MDEPGNIVSIKKWLGAGSINIFGPPYAGKDTHGRFLADKLNAGLLGGGEILRSSVMPKNVKALHRTGKLFPTDVYFQAVLPYLQQAEFAGKPLILSSVGRRQGEAEGVLEAATTAGHPIKAAIYLNVDDGVLWERWKHSDSRKNRGERDDEGSEIMKVRLSEFRSKTLPVIDFYKRQNLLIEIDSNQPKELVINNILDNLLKFSKQ